MKKSDILGLAFKAIEAYSDGKITPDEVIDLAKSGLKAAGVNINEEFFEIFVEQDGDLHFILKKSIVDKLQISV